MATGKRWVGGIHIRDTPDEGRTHILGMTNGRLRFHQATQNDNLGINGGEQWPHVTMNNLRCAPLCTSDQPIR